MESFKNTLALVTLMLLSLVFSRCGSDVNTEDHEEHNKHEEHCLHEENEGGRVELTASQYKNAGIEIGKVENRNLSSILKLNGMVEAPPKQRASISAPMGGFVEKLELVSGMKIRKGQRLVTLENVDYVALQQSYLETKNQFELVELDYKRQQKLSEEKVSSVKVFQETEAAYKKLKVQLKGLSEQLRVLGINGSKLDANKISRKISLYAPFNGYVSSVKTVPGKFVNPSDVILELVDSDNAHVALTVFEKDLQKISVGQKINLRAPNATGLEVEAEVYLIERELDNKRSLRAYGKLLDKEKQLFIGQYVNGFVELNNNQVTTLPDYAIVKSENKTFVFILDEVKMEKKEKVYHFEIKEVICGVSESGYTEVKILGKQPINSMIIATKGAFTLLAKLKNVEGEGGASCH